MYGSAGYRHLDIQPFFRLLNCRFPTPTESAREWVKYRYPLFPAAQGRKCMEIVLHLSQGLQGVCVRRAFDDIRLYVRCGQAQVRTLKGSAVKESRYSPVSGR